MAARVTQAEVEEIIEVDATDTDLTMFIRPATLLVDEELDTTDVGHSDARLKEIELYLSAHFYAIFKPRPGSEKAGPVAETKMAKVGLRLEVTTYGQQAIMLDSSGKLAALNNQKGNKSASLRAIRSVAWEDTTEFDQ